jgi:hypothetical protein
VDRDTVGLDADGALIVLEQGVDKCDCEDLKEVKWIVLTRRRGLKLTIPAPR